MQYRDINLDIDLHSIFTTWQYYRGWYAVPHAIQSQQMLDSISESPNAVKFIEIVECLYQLYICHNFNIVYQSQWLNCPKSNKCSSTKTPYLFWFFLLLLQYWSLWRYGHSGALTFMQKVYLRVSLIPDEEHLFSKWFFAQQTYCASLDVWIPSRD